jgi:hypothetical protein
MGAPSFPVIVAGSLERARAFDAGLPLVGGYAFFRDLASFSAPWGLGDTGTTSGSGFTADGSVAQASPLVSQATDHRLNIIA